MFSSAELIEAVLRRGRARHWLRAEDDTPPGEFPAPWKAWFASIHERVGAATGASATALVEILLQRPLSTPPRRLGDLARWQAFSTLWRQQWHPQSREERHWHWLAGVVSLLWHVFFSAMLLWLMHLQYLALKSPPPEGEDVVQVELIGVGTPDTVGGGPETTPESAESIPAETPTAESVTLIEAVSAPADASPSPSLSNAPVAATLPDMAATVTPTPVIPDEPPQPQPQPPAEQALAVSEPVPDRSEAFVLQAPTPRTAAPTMTAPDLVAPTPAVQVREIPIRLPPAPPTPAPVRVAPAPVADLQAPTPTLRTRAIPMPARPVPTPAPTRSPAVADTAPRVPATPATATTAAGRNPAAASAPTGQRPAAASANAGPAKAPSPGGWPTPQRADDWGQSARNQPGAQRGKDGLYNSDGSVRLADNPGSASPAKPPGTVTQEIADLDRAGTWLRRRPDRYEPTSLDKYWRPSETLLAEWVRKSITTVRIPIPGTSKHIVCQTVLLALGGGCGISDPNLTEQPATARPPPDIPFKPELQEDNGSVRPPPAG